MDVFVAEELLLRIPHFRHPCGRKPAFPKLVIFVQACFP
jgi:hypothetical protein